MINLSFFESRGIFISASGAGEKIRYKCVPGSLTAEIRDLLSKHRESLLAEIRQGENSHQPPEPVTGCDGFVTDQTRANVECDGCDGFFKILHIEKEDDTYARTHAHTRAHIYKVLKNPSHPSKPSYIILNQLVNPQHSPSQDRPTHHTKSADCLSPCRGDRLTCFCCKGTDFWQSIHGVRICRQCHPPAAPELEIFD
jgi:hypothetical protein